MDIDKSYKFPRVKSPTAKKNLEISVNFQDVFSEDLKPQSTQNEYFYVEEKPMKIPKAEPLSQTMKQELKGTKKVSIPNSDSLKNSFSMHYTDSVPFQKVKSRIPKNRSSSKKVISASFGGDSSQIPIPTNIPFKRDLSTFLIPPGREGFKQMKTYNPQQLTQILTEAKEHIENERQIRK